MVRMKFQCSICHRRTGKPTRKSWIKTPGGNIVHIKCLAFFYDSFLMINPVNHPPSPITQKDRSGPENFVQTIRHLKRAVRMLSAQGYGLKGLLHQSMRKTYALKKKVASLEEEIETQASVIRILQHYGYKWDHERKLYEAEIQSYLRTIHQLRLEMEWLTQSRDSIQKQNYAP